MAEIIVQTAGRDALGEFAPDFAHFNDDILFGENWNNEDIDVKTRCIITVVALMAQGVTDNSLKYHLTNAKNHGVSQKEMAAVITHTAFYCGWPFAWAVGIIAWSQSSLSTGVSILFAFSAWRKSMIAQYASSSVPPSSGPLKSSADQSPSLSE